MNEESPEKLTTDLLDNERRNSTLNDNSLSSSTSSITDDDTFQNILDNVKNKDLKKLLNIITEKQDELIEKTNFLNRNNNIITTRLTNCKTENSLLKKKVQEMEEEINTLHENLYNIECDVIKNSQYSRRESLVITGIPDSVKQRDLEPLVLKMINTLGMNISSYEVAACHRLYDSKKDRKYPLKTIIRFTNRKVVDFCLKNRKKHSLIKSKHNLNVRFFESLCKQNELVLKECNDLKQKNIIHDFYTSNGFIKIVKKADDKKSLKIHHPDDIYTEFSDHFETEGNFDQ